MKCTIRAVTVTLVLVSAVGFAGLIEFKLDALQEPGCVETMLASRAKHIFVRWSSQNGIPPAPANLQASIEEGDKLYGTECAACHGLEGSNPTDAGRWMYPRAAHLTSGEIQSYSDRELFWVVKNGIRFSGMPAFGEVESDEHIWNLVQYVRTLPQGTAQQSHGLSGASN
jgi:mono/diheme cytochrome c family protein